MGCWHFWRKRHPNSGECPQCHMRRARRRAKLTSLGF